MPLSDNVTNLYAICPKTGKDANFTQKLEDSADGKETYQSTCECSIQRPKPKETKEST